MFRGARNGLHERTGSHDGICGDDVSVLALVNDVAESVSGGMELVVESFHQNLAALVGLLHQSLGFRGVGGEGFLEKDMFTGLQRLDGPFVVEAIGGADVDYVNDWIGK